MNITNNITLGLLIEKFLEDNYVFRKLQIYEYFENEEMPIKWTHKDKFNQFDLNEIANCKDTCELLDPNIFSDWYYYDKNQLQNFVDEFLYRNLASKFNKTEVKTTIDYLITKSNITKLIYFNPILKDIIKEGRYRITNVSPLTWDASNRIDIEVLVGQKYYLCKDLEKPFIANPCYVVKQTLSGFRVMFFTNIHDNFSDTKKRKINGWGFTTVYSNELGTTPEQAVRQRQN